MVRLESYWSSNKEWWHWDNGTRVMNDIAPDEAKESFRRYKLQLADIDKRTGCWLVIPKNKEGWDYYDDNDADWTKADEESYSDKYMTVVRILYEEFVILRENGVEDFMEDASPEGPVGRTKPSDVQECKKLVEAFKDKAHIFYAGLIEAEEYGMGIEFVEAHIL